MRTKLQKFQDNAQRDNVIEHGKPLYEGIQGCWGANYFGNSDDIILELGCGYGEYTIQLASLFPAKNYIGVDLKGARLWKGSTMAMDQKLSNVVFLRTAIEQLDQFFSVGEVQEIYIPFPDPRPKKRDINKRLTSPFFLDIYRRILKPGGCIYFKTDDLDLFLYTLDVLRAQSDVKEIFSTSDFYQEKNLLLGNYDIQTKYEVKFINQGKTIKYIQLQLGGVIDKEFLTSKQLVELNGLTQQVY